MKKKLVTLFLATVLVFASGTVTQARGNDLKAATSDVITPYYQCISVVTASLSINSLGKAISNGSVHFIGDYSLTLSVELQRSDGTGWSEVKSWGEFFDIGNYHSIEKEYYVTSGHTYRVVTTATIKDGSTVLETGTSISSEVSY